MGSHYIRHALLSSPEHRCHLRSRDHVWLVRHCHKPARDLDSAIEQLLAAPSESEAETRLRRIFVEQFDFLSATGTEALRWGREQIAVVKRAAALTSVPYQTYLKQVVFRQALADIEQAEAVLARR